HPPDDLAAVPLDLLDAHRRPPLPDAADNTDRSDGPAAFGAGAQRERRRVETSDDAAHSRTASADISQRAPRFTAASSRRPIAQRIVFCDTPSSEASDAT